MNNQDKYLPGLIIGAVFLIMILANSFMAWADDSLPVITKESSIYTLKPVVRPSKKNSDTKYNVGIGPIKKITLTTQRQGQDKLNRTHGSPSSSGENSKFKTKIKIIPIKEISSEASESIKVSEGKNERRQRSLPERSAIAGKIQKKSISISKDDIKSERKIKISKKSISAATDQADNIKNRISHKEVKVKAIDQTKEGDKKFKAQIGPIKVIDADNTEKVRSSLRDSAKVTRLMAWRLDESGRKTNKESTIKVIERIMQPPPNMDK